MNNHQVNVIVFSSASADDNICIFYRGLKDHPEYSLIDLPRPQPGNAQKHFFHIRNNLSTSAKFFLPVTLRHQATVSVGPYVDLISLDGALCGWVGGVGGEGGGGGSDRGDVWHEAGERQK